MTLSDDCLDGRSQHFTFPRRGFLQKTVPAALLLAFEPVANSVEKQYPYPAPAFRIGDKIRSPWLEEIEDEEIEEIEDEIGEVMGVCWHPRLCCWQYLVNWTGGDAADWFYPIFDEALISGDDLELDKHD